MANVTAPADLSLSRSRVLFLREIKNRCHCQRGFYPGFMWELDEQILTQTSRGRLFALAHERVYGRRALVKRAEKVGRVGPLIS